MSNVSYYIREYPRPQLFRESYRLLNGKWNFSFGDGLNDEEMRNGFSDKLEILVPFTYQTALSGIGTEERHDVVWYSRKITVTEEQLKGRVLLHFEGSDYETFLWVNGKFIGKDTGGYHRLTFDCTSALHEGENTLTVKVCDDYSVEKPRGKQRSKDTNYGCWYTDTTGIYKTVWMEFLSNTYIKSLIIEPNASTGRVVLSCCIEGECECGLSAEISFGGKRVASLSGHTADGRAVLDIDLTAEDPLHKWELDDPSLYEIQLTLSVGGETVALGSCNAFVNVLGFGLLAQDVVGNVDLAARDLAEKTGLKRVGVFRAKLDLSLENKRRDLGRNLNHDLVRAENVRLHHLSLEVDDVIHDLIRSNRIIGKGVI